MTPNIDREQEPRPFSRFLRALQERAWAILLSVAVCGALAVGITELIPRHYDTTVQVAFSARNAQIASQALSGSGTVPLLHNISTDALILRTSAFATQVSQALPGTPSAETIRSSIKVAADPVADVLEITVFGTQPEAVAKLADAVATEFVRQRVQQIQKSMIDAQSLVKARMDSLTPEEAATAQGMVLKQEATDLDKLLSMQIADYEVLQQAIVPTSPYSPRLLLNLLIGLAVGLALGVLLAMVLNGADRRIKDEATLERLTDLPVLGSLPTSTHPHARGSSRTVVGFREGNESLLEAVRMLRSNLKVLGFGESKRSVLITSTAPDEGKTALAVNLVLGMALAGDRVILVDADFRNPTVHQYLALPNVSGLGDTLGERSASWPSMLQPVDLAPFVSSQLSATKVPAGENPAISKFLCLTSGTPPSNPTEILESGAMADVLSGLQGISDYVIIDGPPMLVASDSLILAQSVDAVVLATTLGKETIPEALEVKQMLARAEIPVLGAVICNSKPRARSSHYGNSGATMKSAAVRNS
jgi:capsular exopolysaccharide synthesis family protein